MSSVVQRLDMIGNRGEQNLSSGCSQTRMLVENMGDKGRYLDANKLKYVLQQAKGSCNLKGC